MAKEIAAAPPTERTDPEDAPLVNWRSPLLVRSVSLTGMFVLAVLYTMYFAAPVLIPVAVAFLLSMMLAPPVRSLARVGCREPVGAAIVLSLLIGGVGGAGYALIDPAQQWLERAPSDLRMLEYRLREFKEPIQRIQEATSQVEAITQMKDGAAAKPRSLPGSRAETNEVLLDGTPRALIGLATLVTLLYFWLAGGDGFLRKLVKLFPKLNDKKRAVDTIRTIQRDISNYLLTIALINTALGLVTAAALWLMGVPNAALWGAVVGLLNFAPFIGAAASALILAGVGLLSFPTLAEALAVPGVFLLITTIEGQVITPMVLGRRLALSPMAIFLTLMVLGWMWGVAGALIAVPLLVSAKIVCERVEGLGPLGSFLAR